MINRIQSVLLSLSFLMMSAWGLQAEDLKSPNGRLVMHFEVDGMGCTVYTLSYKG